MFIAFMFIAFMFIVLYLLYYSAFMFIVC